MSRLSSSVGLWLVDTLTPTGESAKTQVITRTATGGTVDITTAPGVVVEDASIVAATTAAQVKAILESSTNIDLGDITVSGSAGGPFTVTGNIPTLDIDDASATGGTVTVGSVVEAVTSNQYAVSLATDLTEANRITEAVRKATGWKFDKEDIDVPDLQDDFPKTIPGKPTKPAPMLEVYLNDDAGSKDYEVESRLVEDATGYIVRSTHGRSPGAGDNVQVWPIRVKSATPTGDADATSTTAQVIEIALTCPETPDLHVVLGA